MANQSDVKIVLTAQDNASKTLKNVGEQMKASLTGISVAAGVAGAGLAAFVGKAVKDFSEAEAAQKQLEHATLAVAGGTREQLKALQDLSVELEKKGVLDGDSIAVGLAQLETFGLSTDMVKNLGGSLADLAVNQYGVNASSEQLTASANMIAKALNGEFSQLEKSGIRFTDAQKHMIEFGNETEKTTALQEGFAQNLKYTNEVAKQTTEGGLASLKVSLGNISENIGAAVTPALGNLLKSVEPIITKISDWTAANPELVAKILAVTAGVLALVAALAPMLAFFAVLGPAIGTATVIFGALLSPITLVVIAIGLLVAAIIYLIANWDTIGPKVKEVWENVKATVTDFVGQIVEKITGFAGLVIAGFTKMWDDTVNAFKTAIYFVIGVVDFLSTQLLGVSLPQIVNGFKTGWQILSDAVKGLVQSMSDVIIGIWDGLKAAAQAMFDGIMAIIDAVTKPITALWTALWDGLTKAFNSVVDAIKSPIQSLFDWISAKFEAIKSIASSIGKAVSSLAGGAVSSGKSITGTRALGGPVAQGNAYLVGENGPEIFQPYTGGGIIPNNRIGVGAGNVNVTVNVGRMSSDLDVHDMARVVGDEIMRSLKQNQLLGA